MKKTRITIEQVSSVEPLGSRVIVRRLDEGETSEGGNIYIPEHAREERRLAEVVYSGKGRYQNGSFIPNTLKPGDIVLTVKHKGVVLEMGDEKLQVLDESDCMAKVTL